MKVLITIALLLALLASYGCVLQNAPPVIAGNSCKTMADCPVGSARCLDGACTGYDEYGCVPSGGYAWCAAKQKCLRAWEENCANPAIPQACTMEAKICPDGSAVGRQGPKCEFAACPQENYTLPQGNYTLYGKITIGPLCPVEPCDRAFDYSSVRVNVYYAAGGSKAAATSADASGYYGVNLQPGNYLVNVTDASGNSFGLPSLDYTQSFSIEKGHLVNMDFDIDTGIR